MEIALILFILNSFQSTSQITVPPQVEPPEFVLESLVDSSVVMFINCPANFVGGPVALKSFIQSKMVDVNMNWTDSIPKKRGRVTFIVEKDGSLTDIRIYQSVSPEIDALMISMVKEMPPWEPACDQYGTCRERILLPVNFSRKN